MNVSERGGDDPRAVIERLSHALNAHDIDAFEDCFDPDYDSEQPAHPERTFKGRDQVRKNWSSIFASVPDLAAELLVSIAEGETVVSEWHWVGTQADHEPFDWRGVTVMGVRSGRIVWGRLYMEPVEQFGLDIDATVQQMTGQDTVN